MNSRLGFLLTLIFAASFFSECIGQTIHTPYHQRIDLTRGLPSDVIYEINQDKKGTLWMASEKGLFSYNGFSYSAYQIEKSNYYTNDVINVKIDYLNRPIALDFSRYLFIASNNGLVYKEGKNSVPQLDNYTLKVLNFSDHSYITDGASIYKLVDNTFYLEYEITNPSNYPLVDFYKAGKNTLKLLLQNGEVITYTINQKTIVSEIKYPLAYYAQVHPDYYVSLAKDALTVKTKDSTFLFSIPKEINTNNIYRHSFIHKSQKFAYGVYSSHMFVINLSQATPKVKWFYINDASTLSSLMVTGDGTIYISTLGDGLYKINTEWLNASHITYNTNSKILSYNKINDEEIAYQKRRIYFYKNNRLDRSIPVREDVLIRDIVYLEGNYYAAGSRFLFKIPADVFKQISEFSYSSLAPYIFSNQATKDVKVFNNDLYFTTATYLIKYSPKTNTNDTLIRQRCEKMFNYNNLLFVNTEEYLRVYNREATNVLNLNIKAKAMSFKDSTHLLILSKTNDLFLFDIKTQKLTHIKLSLNRSVDDILWYKNYLYVSNPNGILKLNYFEHNQTTAIVGSYDFEHYDMELINQDGKFIFTSNRGVMAVQITDFFTKRKLPNYLAIESSNGIMENNVICINKLTNHLNINIVDQNLACNRYYAIVDGDTAVFKSGNIQLGKITEGESEIEIIGFDRFNRSSKPLKFKVINSVPFLKSELFNYLLIATIMALLFFITLRTYRYRIKIINIQTSNQNKEMETRLVALRSQMNPHFIYNVLNTAQSFMFSNNIKQANNIISKLSHIIREVLESTKTRYIELGEEIKLITEYCDLEQARYDNKFSYEIKVDPNLNLKLKIPYFFIQPLVENAIWHGLIKDVKNKKRKLVVSFFQQDNEVKITIDDNGVGYDPANVREGSVAIGNLKERIELKKQLRKIDTTLSIENKKSLNVNDKGTICELIIKMPEYL